MRIASLPLNDDLRLQDLYAYDILDTGVEQEFDDLLEVASKIYGCPIAAITFIDRDRQFLKATRGIDKTIRETGRDVSFCAHTILEQKELVVTDTLDDERFANNPFVQGEMGIRFYAGVPIVSKSGYKLGTVCVIDREPRAFEDDGMRVLTIIAKQISKLLELRLKNKLLLEKAEEQMHTEQLLTQRMLAEQEQSFRQIGTELHENIAQSLAATKYFLELVSEESLAKEDLIGKCRQTVAGLVEQVRALSRSIVPTTLNEFDLEELLGHLLSQFYNRTGVEAKLVYEGRQLPPAIAMCLYRVVEEQLKNIRQHAGASKLMVNIQVGKAVYLSIKDNGAGIELAHFKKGTGMQKIVTWVESLQGMIDVSGFPGAGCELKITIPLQQECVVEC